MSRLYNILAKLVTNPIIEKGTSGAWTYRKYADGTYECWSHQEATKTVNANTVLSFGTPSFPVTFAERPVISVSGGGDGQPSVAPFYSKSSTTGADIWVFNRMSSTFTGKIYVDIHAIGKLGGVVRLLKSKIADILEKGGVCYE